MRFKLSWRISSSAAAIMVIGFAIMILYIGFEQHSYSQRSGDSLLELRSMKLVNSAMQTINAAEDTAFSMAANASAILSENPTNREAVGRLISQAVSNNANIIGMGIAGKVDSIGLDADHKNKAFSDAEGRLSSYFYINDGEIQRDLVEIIPENGSEFWYDLPMKERKLILMEPYLYPVEDTEIFMITASSPIILDGKVLGTTGADVALTELNEVFAQDKVWPGEFAGLVSANKVWVAHPDKEKLANPVENEASALSVEQALQGQKVNKEIHYNNKDWVMKVQPVEFMRSGTGWAVVTLVPKTEFFAASTVLLIEMVIAAVIVVFVVIIALLWIGVSIASPVVWLTNAARKIADGDTSLTIKKLRRNDEISDLSVAIDTLQQAQKHRQELSLDLEQKDKLEKLRSEKQNMLKNIGDDLVNSVQSTAKDVENAFGELQSNIKDLAKKASDSIERSNQVNQSTNSANEAATGIAASTHEMSATIAEIAEQATKTAQMTSSASERTQNMTDMIAKLDGSVNQIGDVVSLINEIADQTNLLALNATIEAARAGDAGKGFAVVASEVKSLATQTSKATDEIRLQITEIQATTNTAVDSIHSVTDSISEVDETTQSIAAAIDEQQATTYEISQQGANVAARASETKTSIERLIDDNAWAHQQTEIMINQLNMMSEKIAQMSKSIDTSIQRVFASDDIKG